MVLSPIFDEFLCAQKWCCSLLLVEEHIPTKTSRSLSVIDFYWLSKVEGCFLW